MVFSNPFSNSAIEGLVNPVLHLGGPPQSSSLLRGELADVGGRGQTRPNSRGEENLGPSISFSLSPNNEGG